VLTWTASFGDPAVMIDHSLSFAPLPHFEVSGFPNPAIAGDVNTFTVMVKDFRGNVFTNYLGTVHITSTDDRAILPRDYTFTAADRGVHTFGAVLQTVGMQSIIATDDTSFSPEVVMEQQANIQVVEGASAPAGRGQTGKPSVIIVTPAPSDTQS